MTNDIFTNDLVSELNDLFAVDQNPLIRRAAVEHEALRVIASQLYDSVQTLRSGVDRGRSIDDALFWYEYFLGN